MSSRGQELVDDGNEGWNMEEQAADGDLNLKRSCSGGETDVPDETNKVKLRQPRSEAIDVSTKIHATIIKVKTNWLTDITR